MRFVIYSVFAVLWIVMWWWTYTCHIKRDCCAPGGADSAVVAQLDEGDRRSLLFRWSDPNPVQPERFATMKDSLIRELDDDEILEITGFAFRDETNPAVSDLGEARAERVRDLMLPGVDSSQIRVRSAFANLTGDARNQLFESVQFNFIENPDYVRDIEPEYTLYFPNNSTEMVTDSAAVAYLNRLVGRMQKTGETVSVTGHTDDRGPNTENYYLGLWRAESVRDHLVEMGVPDERIIVESKGEMAPVASNRTADGRNQNRRVEIVLNKQQ